MKFWAMLIAAKPLLCSQSRHELFGIAVNYVGGHSRQVRDPSGDACQQTVDKPGGKVDDLSAVQELPSLR